MKDFKEEMKERTLNIATSTLQMVNVLPKSMNIQIIKRQLIRSVTSVGANYHAACRAKSEADFIYKLHIVEEECDESIYWMELLSRLNAGDSTSFKFIKNELHEILAIVISSIRTIKEKSKK